MFNKLFVAVMLLAGLTSCKSKDGFNYSQDIVAKEKKLEPAFTVAREKIQEFAKEGNYDSIGAVSVRMETLVQNTINDIDKMKLPSAKGAADFKSAVMTYFKYMKSMWTSYKDWATAPTEEDKQGELGKVEKLEKEGQEVVEEMQKAQRKYATDNGFKIEN